MRPQWGDKGEKKGEIKGEIIKKNDKLTQKKLQLSAPYNHVYILDSTLDLFYIAKRPNWGSTMRPQWGEKGEGKGEGKGENERKNDRIDAKNLCFLLYITTYTS